MGKAMTREEANEILDFVRKGGLATIGQINQALRMTGDLGGLHA